MNTIGAGEEACEEVGEWDLGQLSKVINGLGTDGGHLTGGEGQSRPHIQNHVVCYTKRTKRLVCLRSFTNAERLQQKVEVIC